MLTVFTGWRRTTHRLWKKAFPSNTLCKKSYLSGTVLTRLDHILSHITTIFNEYWVSICRWNVRNYRWICSGCCKRWNENHTKTWQWESANATCRLHPAELLMLALPLSIHVESMWNWTNTFWSFVIEQSFTYKHYLTCFRTTYSFGRLGKRIHTNTCYIDRPSHNYCYFSAQVNAEKFISF